MLRTLGETEEAQAQLKLYQQELQDQNNRTLAASKAAQGDKELATGDPQKAVAYFREAVQATPQDLLFTFKLAMALDRTGGVDEERTLLEHAIQINPGFALAQNQLGYLASRSGDSAGAEEHFRRAVQAAPGYVQAWVSLAATLGMESRIPEAQQALASALRLDPQNAQALQLRKDLEAAAPTPKSIRRRRSQALHHDARDMTIKKSREWTRRRMLQTLGTALAPAFVPGGVRAAFPATSAAAKTVVPFSHFVDVAASAGLTQKMFYGDDTKNTYIIEVNGAGCAFFDYDNDGWMDIFMLSGRRLEGVPGIQQPPLPQQSRRNF